jgi:hypothetical protein
MLSSDSVYASILDSKEIFTNVIQSQTNKPIHIQGSLLIEDLEEDQLTSFIQISSTKKPIQLI